MKAWVIMKGSFVVVSRFQRECEKKQTLDLRSLYIKILNLNLFYQHRWKFAIDLFDEPWN